MALLLPPAVSVKRFRGGFKSIGFEDLADTETNNAENVEYGQDGDLQQRGGSRKILNDSLDGTATTGQPIRLHYYFKKTDTTRS